MLIIRQALSGSGEEEDEEIEEELQREFDMSRE